MDRPILSLEQIDPGIHSDIGGREDYRRTVKEVSDAVGQHDVVIVGMAQNPFPKKARKLLDSLGIGYHYMEYGSYTKEWKRRGALKMWSGWQTFPMIFIKGVFIGGYSDLQALNQSGELTRRLSAS